jgi:hypothetical protein
MKTFKIKKSVKETDPILETFNLCLPGDYFDIPTHASDFITVYNLLTKNKKSFDISKRDPLHNKITGNAPYCYTRITKKFCLLDSIIYN